MSGGLILLSDTSHLCLGGLYCAPWNAWEKGFYFDVYEHRGDDPYQEYFLHHDLQDFCLHYTVYGRVLK